MELPDQETPSANEIQENRRRNNEHSSVKPFKRKYINKEP